MLAPTAKDSLNRQGWEPASGLDQRWLVLSVVGGLILGGCEVAEAGMQPGVVVSVDSLHQGVLGVGEGLERSVPVDDLGLEQSDGGFASALIAT